MTRCKKNICTKSAAEFSKIYGLMSKEYNPANVESAAQKFWDEKQSFQVIEDPEREKFYCLSMFPYPSGALHMGHVRNYSIGDAMSRYQRMLGKNVLQPMGWDAFGLPAENAAIAKGVPAANWTYENIEYMKRQLKRLGFGYDWSRELATCRPEYYRWEQWFFTRLIEKDLAYRKMAVVNWDPVEQTVLANEQVDSSGRGWRSGALVEKREIPQWFIRITAYADELLEELDNLPGWPESVKTMQRNWIGRSEGVEFDIPVEGDHPPLRVFTTRPDTLMGITYAAVAPEYPLARQIAKSDPEIAEFIETCKLNSTSEAAIESMEKKGLQLPVSARHPVSGERLPIFVANFVLITYGTGAIMAVPGHDQRDWEFARKYGIDIRKVVRPADGDVDLDKGAYVDKADTVSCNSGEFDGLDFAGCFDATADYLVAHANGKRTINYRLRDWGVSRQRYWGCPVPVVYDSDNGLHPVPDDQLPVVLPEDVEFQGVRSPIRDDPAFVETTVPGTDAPGRRETDTFDTFVESSWYFARFCCPGAAAKVDERANYWLPVDHYIGGIEHAVLHLLYARLYHKLMRDTGLINSDEPFTNLLTQGMVLKDGSKMSKSVGNVVDPQEMIDQYGADSVRLFILFASPPRQTLEWNDEALAGAHRFLNRIWNLVTRFEDDVRDYFAARENVTFDDFSWAASLSDQPAKDLRLQTHTLLKRICQDFERHQYNTAIAACMELCNAATTYGSKFSKADPAARLDALVEAILVLVRALAPIVPHICHELWLRMGFQSSLLDAAWPKIDETALVQDTITLPVQVNGKLRGQIQVGVTASRDEISETALNLPGVQRFVYGNEVRKIIIVPAKMVNIVV